MFSIAAFTALLSLASTAFAQEGVTSSSVAALVAQLRLAPTEADRFGMLTDDQFIFDFNNPSSTVGVTTGLDGHTVQATSANFPAVVGQGVSMTIGYLGPCALNSPHMHPRATEINFSVNTTLRGGVLVENGARFAEIDIRPGTATVFPQGAIHFEMNPTCESAMFVAGFNGEDPGVSQVAQRFFGLPPDIVGAALGGLGIQEVADLEALIPDNVIFGVDSCLAACNITRTGQNTSQRQPRVSANAFPSGVTPTNIFSLPTDTPVAPAGVPANPAVSAAAAASASSASTASSAAGSATPSSQADKREEVVARELHAGVTQFALRR